MPKNKILKKECRLITAALPYVNNVPHLGHIVGCHLPADIFARFCRLKGYSTLFIGGTDEHGTPSEIAALEKGISPKELCNYYYRIHKKIYQWFGFSYDNFSRTSRPIHHKTTKQFFKEVYKNGYIFEKEMVLPYCLSCQRFLPDRYIEGTCPFCGFEKARGDQCDHCGHLLDPKDLKDPYCVLCKGKKIVFKKSKHLFLDLSRLEKKLKKWIQKKKWRKQVKTMALGWIKEGLRPRSISRDLSWGIKIPLKGYRKKVFYVWFEAPIGYLSATKEALPKTWQKYWQNPKAKIYHFIGKDNIPFHTIFWPASLMVHGKLNLPYNVIGLQYLNYEGKKFSKSRKWGVFCENLPELGLEPDYWRFYLGFLIPETSDTDFKWEEFKQRINGELIGNIANFIYRVLSLNWYYYRQGISSFPSSQLSSLEKELIKKVIKEIALVEKSWEEIELREALKRILKISSWANKYFDKKRVWSLVKEDKKEGEKTIFVCLYLCQVLAVLLSPYLPQFSLRVWQGLGFKNKPDEKGNLEKIRTLPNKSFKIKKPQPLLAKIDDKKISLIRKKATKID